MVYNLSIKTNKWNKFPWCDDLKVYMDGKEIISPQFAKGKYFFFIYLGNNRALKFIHHRRIADPVSEIEKTIEIQKLFHKNDISFDCEEKVETVIVEDLETKQTVEYRGYITGTAIDNSGYDRINCENDWYRNDEFMQSVIKVCADNGIKRSRLGSDLWKRKNYIISNGDVRYVDIDPKFYYDMDESLKKEIIDNGQFPFHRRKCQYQSIEDESMPGIRDMLHRYEILSLPHSFQDKTVLDIGCNLGMICIMSKKKGARFCAGIDIQEEAITAANKYLDAKKYKDVQLMTYDINNGLEGVKPLLKENKFDYVFALSILKHVDQKALFDIINFYTKEICWFEGHNKQSKEKIQKILEDNIECKEIKFLGYTTDRGVRPNFIIKK